MDDTDFSITIAAMVVGLILMLLLGLICCMASRVLRLMRHQRLSTKDDDEFEDDEDSLEDD